MRVINIKILSFTHLRNVWVAVLLLLTDGVWAQSAVSLTQQAQQQQQKLLDQFGPWLDPQRQQQCQQLINELALTQFKTCQLLDADFANAYAFAHGTVMLTRGLFVSMNNSDQLAHVLAHEHAHLAMNHHQQAQQLINHPPVFFTKSRIKKFYRQIEQQADRAATEMLLAHQRDPLQIHHYLMRIEQQVKAASQDHQQLKDRIQRSHLPVEVMDADWHP